MSSSYAGPSSEVTETHPTSSGLTTTQIDTSGTLGEDRPQPVSPLIGSPKHRDHVQRSPSNGLDIPAVRVAAHRELGRIETTPDPEQQEDRPLYQYISIWRKNFVLTLDGGGVRGYSQLIILKVLMERVASLERDMAEKDGIQMDSSFHPISLEEVAQKKLWLSSTVERTKTGEVPRRHTNGQATSNGSGKGKDVAPQTEEATMNLSSTEDTSQFYPHHYFDWIAGTSTGGLNAIMLGRLRMSVDECMASYADLAEAVFGNPRLASYRFSPFFWFCAKYSGDRLRDVVKKVVLDHLCEGESSAFAMNKDMCRTVVVAFKKNVVGVETEHLFRTYNHQPQRPAPVRNENNNTPNPIERVGPADSSYIWEVARATSAAPTYFSTIKIGEDEYMDGGFGSNNPSHLMYFEVSQMNNDLDEANALSLSIGTGITTFTRFQNGLLRRPLGWFNAAKKISTDCEQKHALMEKLTARGRKLGKCAYYRFNVPDKRSEPEAAATSSWKSIKHSIRGFLGHNGEHLDRGLGKIKLDEWKSRGRWRKESTQQEIERVTREYLNGDDIKAQLDEVALKMVEQRRARAETPRWATYALGVKYKCPVDNERCPDDTWAEPQGLKTHLIQDHKLLAGTDEAESHLDAEVLRGRYFEHHH